MEKLRPEVLEKVSGGSWNINTITEEEYAELHNLEEQYLYAHIVGDWMMMDEIDALEDEFYARMDAKYGPNK